MRYENTWDRNHPSGEHFRPSLDDGQAVSAPVATYLPNGWGVYDMHGNVGEWCRDGFPNPFGDDAMRGSRSGTFPVERGGSWTMHADYARSAHRGLVRASGSTDSTGFRLVSPLPEPKLNK